MAGVPIGPCGTFAKLGSQSQSWTGFEHKAQPGSALSLACLPNLGAQLLLFIRNRLQRREPGSWEAGRTLSTVQFMGPFFWVQYWGPCRNKILEKSLSPVWISKPSKRPYLLRSCLLNSYYVLSTFHSNIQSFPMRQDFYCLRLRVSKLMPLRRDRAQICLTSKPLLVPLHPLTELCSQSCVT